MGLLQDILTSEFDEGNYEDVNNNGKNRCNKIDESDKYFLSQLDFSQEKAVLSVDNKKIVTIEGPPGTGKSEVIASIISNNIEVTNKNIEDINSNIHSLNKDIQDCMNELDEIKSQLYSKEYGMSLHELYGYQIEDIENVNFITIIASNLVKLNGNNLVGKVNDKVNLKSVNIRLDKIIKIYEELNENNAFELIQELYDV
ncbi:MAG: hypothetical protein ACRCXA_05225, partial [Peptostreptococcaceae bacterium]